jgi:multiple sugar transport system permease protein
MAVADQTSPKPLASPKKKQYQGLQREQSKWGWIFISPWVIGFLVFTLLPVIATLVFSFTNYNPVQPDNTQFIGVQNYLRMFQDAKVGKSLQVTITYALLAMPISFIFGLLLASLVNSVFLIGQHYFRTLYYMTSMIPVVAAGVI